MTTRTEGDVSTFALDVYWASGRRAEPELESHIASCARCLAYLARLQELAEDARAEPVAAPVAVVPDAVPAATAKQKHSWALPSAIGAGLALAAGVLLLVRGRPPEREYVAAKGTPAVQVLVHRSADTWVWDGHSPVRPGDALALRIACEGLDHVAVASPGAQGLGRIADVECPVGGSPLPFTLVVDDAPGDEQLAVVLSREALDDDSLRDAIGESRHAADVWVAGFVLPKETGSER
jgi:anti-sigma factor RsiW